MYIVVKDTVTGKEYFNQRTRSDVLNLKVGEYLDIDEYTYTILGKNPNIDTESDELTITYLVCKGEIAC